MPRPFARPPLTGARALAATATMQRDATVGWTLNRDRRFGARCRVDDAAVAERVAQSQGRRAAALERARSRQTVTRTASRFPLATSLNLAKLGVAWDPATRQAATDRRG